MPPAQSVSLLQVFAHAPAVHRNGVHDCESALQWPPEHCPASVSVDVLAQPAGEHVVPSAYFWQPPAPSHLPFVPQVGAVWSVQAPFGSTLPALKGAQSPALPVTLQALHDEQLAEPQHTVSTQLFVVHWLPLAQLCPFVFFWTQLPPAPVQ